MRRTFFKKPLRSLRALRLIRLRVLHPPPRAALHSFTMTFVPHPRLRNGHLMTLYAWARPRRFPRLPPPVDRYFDVAEAARVLAHCHWQPKPRETGTLL